MMQVGVELVGAAALGSGVLALMLGLWLGRGRERSDGMDGINSLAELPEAPPASAMEQVQPLEPRAQKFEFMREFNGEFCPTGEFFYDFDRDTHEQIQQRQQAEGVSFAARLVDDQ